MFSERSTRRQFGTQLVAAASALSARVASAQSPDGTGEKIRVACIGAGRQGRKVAKFFKRQKDCQIVALCDVHSDMLDETDAALGGGLARYKDFRELLNKEDFGAVVIATPDHWHALAFIACAEAKKDIYIEKPVSRTIVEGRKMVETAERNQIITQVGTVTRSSPLVQEAIQRIHQGDIGKVTIARAYRVSNMSPTGIGKAPDSDPPPQLDWNMWLGPAPYVPYNENRCLYKFRWHKAYSSQIANHGVHALDLIRWGLNETAPSRIAALGGIYAIDDSRDIPDTAQILLEWPSGALATWGQYEANSGPALAGPPAAFVEFYGTEGTLWLGAERLVIRPATGGQFQSSAARMKAEDKSGGPDVLDEHVRNFLDCIKSRQQTRDNVLEGHLSTSVALAANIALEVGQVLQWDATQERFRDNDAANKLLQYEYRSPWKLPG